MSNDERQLDLLSTFYSIVGGLTAILACLPLVHLGIGIGMVAGYIPDKAGNPFSLWWMGWLFIGVALLFIVLGWVYAIGMLIAGRRLRQRRAYVACFVMAALTCLQFPFGTCLGVLTIIVLTRPSTKLLFEKETKPIGLDEL